MFCKYNLLYIFHPYIFIHLVSIESFKEIFILPITHVLFTTQLIKLEQKSINPIIFDSSEEPHYVVRTCMHITAN